MGRIQLFLILMFGLTACQTQRPIGWDTQRVEPRPYISQLQDWTRHEVAYHQIESRLFVHATCISPTFAAVYAREKADRTNMAATEAISLRENWVQTARNETKFVVSVATGDPYWNDMVGAKATLKTHLILDEPLEVVQPTKIRRLTPNEQADLRPFFEYLTPLAQAYIVTFPTIDNRKRLRLRVAGTPGVVELIWDLKQ